MMDEIPEWAIRDAREMACDGWSGDAPAISIEDCARALVAQMEADCRPVCSCCDNAQLYPLKEVEAGNWWHYKDGELYVPCAANSIRQSAADRSAGKE